VKKMGWIGPIWLNLKKSASGYQLQATEKKLTQQKRGKNNLGESNNGSDAIQENLETKYAGKNLNARSLPAQKIIRKGAF
jgi:hypothetical protein